ncbi:MAG TPA: ABC transporter permease [Candidatus Angelobacter sp.]|nr:ABC transporter permease [Candidatus Angelobacter sp.]
MRRTVRQRLTVLGLTAPAYLWLTVAIFLPLSAMFCFSFLSALPLPGRSVSFTLDNYRTIFSKQLYLINTKRSLLLGLHVTLGCIAIGYPAALALAKYVRGRWREAVFLLIVLPFWSNGLVRTFSWTMVLRKDALLDWFVRLFVPDAPSLDLLFSYPAILIGLIHAYVPYMILTCYVSLQAIDDSLIEAARSLGASAFTAFRRIILPLSLPGLVAGTILIFVPVIGSFMEPEILGGKEAIMLGPIIERQFTASANWPLGAALSFVLLAIVLAIFAATWPFLRPHLRDA